MRLAVLFFVALAAPAIAGATTLEPIPLAQMVARAERIVTGSVESSESRWTAGKRAIVTIVTVRVEEGGGIKGARSGELITFAREGGEVDGKGQLVSGAARFTVGESVLVLLERRGGTLWTVAMGVGKMHIDTIDGQRVAVHGLAGIGFTRTPPDEPFYREATRPLAAMMSDISRLVSEQR